jgi:hypothetical protein
MVRRAAFAIALLAATLCARAQQRPAFTRQAGVVAATLPASVLQDERVKKQLGSGLTTTFLVAVRVRESDRVTGARIEVRYDLWDEVWHVKRVEFDGKVDRQRIASAEALERWWHAPLRLFESTADRVLVQVEVNVLPFSAAEETDARAWIAKSGGVGTGSGGGLVDALIGTTISAKPITSFRWNVDLTLR